VPTLRDTPLVPASVPRSATFLDAANALSEHEISAIAVLEDDGRVAGLFTNDDLLRGLFPRYLEQLKHTAFLEREPAALAARLENAAREPVVRHMRRPVTVEVDTTAMHVAERFLHCEWGAVAVVEKQRFLGMLEETAFCRVVMERRAEAAG
jgi:CBS domain-containing protein